MHKFFNTISRNLAFIVSASMLFGFVYGLIFPVDLLKSFIVPCIFLAIYPMMVSLKIERFFKGNDIKLQFSTQLINFCVIPFVSFGIGMVFFKDSPYMLLGFLLVGLLPTGGGTISWTGLSKGNVESATKMAVIGPIMGVILAPFYLKFLVGPTLDMDIFMVIKQMVFIIVLPMFFGVLTRKLLLAMNEENNPRKGLLTLFPSFSVIGMIGIVFIAMALKARDIAQDPLIFMYLFFPVILLYFFSFTLTTVIGRVFFSRSSTIAFVYGSSMRNLSIALAIAMNLFDGKGSSAALVITVAYIIQIQMAAWYTKFINKIFVPKKSPRPVLSEV